MPRVRPRTAEAVGARAQVAGRVDRAAAERARLHGRPPTTAWARLAERPGQPGRQPYDEHLLGLGLLDLLLGLVPGSTTASSVTGNTSTTTRSSAASQDSVMVPARNSSTMGCSSGSLSSSADRGHRRDRGLAPAWRASARRAARRSARRGPRPAASPARRWSPGCRCAPAGRTCAVRARRPCPATKRSGGSKLWMTDAM